MRIPVVLVAVLVLIAGPCSVAQADADGTPAQGPRPAASELRGSPGSPGPSDVARHDPAQAAATVSAGPAPVVVTETEPGGQRGGNDTPASAQAVPGFGTGATQAPQLRITGALSPERVTPEPVPPNVEDDGSIPLARDTGIGTVRRGIETTGVIGDGPHGSAGTGTGDSDFYRLRAVAGQRVTVDMDASQGALVPDIGLLDGSGKVLAGTSGVASHLETPVPTTGTYVVIVTEFTATPRDFTDPSSGLGVGTEGPYRVRITAGQADVDTFAVGLRRGDVLGVSVDGGAGRVSVSDPPPVIEDVHGSTIDASSAYPSASPLPRGGRASVDHVADQDGVHYLQVSDGDGAYQLTVAVYRPGPERTGIAQTIFLDLDGARLSTDVFDPAAGPRQRSLSPLRTFLPGWGLTEADLPRLTSALLTEVRSNLRDGPRSPAGIRVLSSVDSPDPWGKPGVSRVIVGGTVAESAVDTIGIAESIDPGNFAEEETALVLLDKLSAPPGGEDTPLTDFFGPSSDRLAWVAHMLALVVSHEVGHLLGDWHTDHEDQRLNVMDTLLTPALAGADRVGGTRDDPRPDFGEDRYAPDDFTGVEDTLTRITATAPVRLAGRP